MKKRFDEIYRSLLTQILVEGTEVGPRGMLTLELIGVQINLSSCQETLLLSPERDLNYRFAIAEALWIISGSNKLAPLLRVNKKYAQYSDDGETLAGAYGPRLASQSLYISYILKNDPVTRQAVATIWTPCPPPSKDIPCTISVQFLNRNGKLHSIWTMRSSDAWLGLPYDVFSFGLYTNFMASGLKLMPGSMQINIGSSHLYAKHQDAARQLASTTMDILTIPQFSDCYETLVDAAFKDTKHECLLHLLEKLRTNGTIK